MKKTLLELPSKEDSSEDKGIMITSTMYDFDKGDFINIEEYYANRQFMENFSGFMARSFEASLKGEKFEINKFSDWEKDIYIPNNPGMKFKHLIIRPNDAYKIHHKEVPLSDKILGQLINLEKSIFIYEHHYNTWVHEFVRAADDFAKRCQGFKETVNDKDYFEGYDLSQTKSLQTAVTSGTRMFMKMFTNGVLIARSQQHLIDKLYHRL